MSPVLFIFRYSPYSDNGLSSTVTSKSSDWKSSSPSGISYIIALCVSTVCAETQINDVLKINKNSYKTRPLLSDPEAFDELYEQRINIYRACADYEYSNNGSSKDTLLYLLRKMRVNKR